MGPGGPGGPGKAAKSELDSIKPHSLREVPNFLSQLLGKFFSRLFYVFRLVWEARPWILFVMLFMSVWSGVMPIVSAYINRALLNSLAAAYIGEAAIETVLFLLLHRYEHAATRGTTQIVRVDWNKFLAAVLAHAWR